MLAEFYAEVPRHMVLLCSNFYLKTKTEKIQKNIDWLGGLIVVICKICHHHTLFYIDDKIGELY